MQSLKSTWVMCACVALATAVLAGCSAGQASGSAAAAAPAATPVQLAAVRSVTVNDSSDYVATLKSRNSAVISPQVDGQIVQIYVRSGERVKAGAPLVQIDPLKQEATVHSQEGTRFAKEADVRWAQQQYDRSRQLFAAGVVSKQDLDSSRAAFDSAKAQLAALNAQVRQEQVQLRYYRVLAPRDGIVGDIPVRVGDRVSPATVLTTVDQPGALEAYVEVPVERARALRSGLPVEILNSEEKAIARGHVDFISPEVSNQTQTVLAKATIPNPQGVLRTAQFTRARVIWGSHPGLLIPVLSVVRINGQYFAFLAEDDGKGGLVAHQRKVQIGDMLGNDYVVQEGVKAGEKIITSGTQLLVDGAPVTPQT
jgi:RND family efflux transporter MFP subunit